MLWHWLLRLCLWMGHLGTHLSWTMRSGSGLITVEVHIDGELDGLELTRLDGIGWVVRGSRGAWPWFIIQLVVDRDVHRWHRVHELLVESVLVHEIGVIVELRLASVRCLLVEHVLYLGRSRRQLSSLPDAVKLRKAGLIREVVHALMRELQVVAWHESHLVLWGGWVLVNRLLLVQIRKVSDPHSTEGACALLRVQLQVIWHLAAISVWQLLKSCLRLARAFLFLKRQVIWLFICGGGWLFRSLLFNRCLLFYSLYDLVFGLIIAFLELIKRKLRS